MLTLVWSLTSSQRKAIFSMLIESWLSLQNDYWWYVNGLGLKEQQKTGKTDAIIF